MSGKKLIPREPELLSLLCALLLVLLIASLSFRAWRGFELRDEGQAATQRIVNDTNAVLSALKDAETGQRGYLLTGQDRYLDPYLHAVATLPGLVDALSRATASRPEQASRLKELKPLVAAKLDELRETIELRRNRGPDAALAVMLSGRGEVLMDQIREKCAALQTVSASRLRQQSEESLSSANQLGLISTIGSAVLFFLLALSTRTIQREATLRRQLNAELQKTEEQTRQARDWLRTTIESIGDAVIATDAAGRITLLNAVAQSLTGWTQEQAVGLPLDRIFVISNEETGVVVSNPVAAVLREGRIVGLANHTVLTARGGRRIPIEDSAAPILDDQKNVAGVVLVFRDVSQARAAERSEKDAAAAVARQTDLLARANTELQQFTNSASHDLREPLRSITAFAERLQLRSGSKLDEEDAETLRFILAGAARMSHLVDSLLEYSRSGEITRRQLRPVRMEEILNAALENLRESIAEGNAVITHDPLPSIVMDEIHAGQLFQNLIDNALKYRREQTPMVHIAAREQANGWLFSVEDNGQGIASPYRRQIFEPFRRLHDQGYPGAGIGLATCKKVVELYGGHIWVESELGRGSTFFFNIPAMVEDGKGQLPALRSRTKVASQAPEPAKYAE